MLAAVIATLTVAVVLATFFRSWLMAKGSMRLTYWAMIVAGILGTVLNVIVGLNTPEQAALLLFCLVYLWQGAMGIKGLRRISRNGI